MGLFFWIFDLLMPSVMVFFGLLFRSHPPPSINWVYGYRTSRSMKSLEAWDYAHRRLGRLWTVLGIMLFCSIAASKLLIPLPEEQLSLYHVGIGMLVMLASIPLVERDLERRFR